MFDFNQTIVPAPWQTALAVGDLLRFRYPMSEGEQGGELPPLRPCLVLEIERRGVAPRMTLAPGTSRQTRARSAYEVTICAWEEISAAGLARPYRFLARRPLSVSLDHPHLCKRVGGVSPVIGQVTGISRERLQRLRARLHAEHDILAERRREAGLAQVEVSLKPASCPR